MSVKLAILACLLSAACTTAPRVAPSYNGVSVVGSLEIATGSTGWPDSLSGLAYLPSTNEFVAISDERKNPQAFYLRLSLDRGGIRASTLRIRDFEPPGAGGADGYPDHEDVAAFASGELIIASERGDSPLRRLTTSGQLRELPIPVDFERGEKHGMPFNAGIEGIALAPSERYLAIANEKPLLQDEGRRIHLAFIDLRATKVIRQLDYIIDALPGVGVTAMAFADATTLLVLERGWDPETKKNTARIYRLDLTLDQRGFPSAASSKELVVDLERIYPRLDNFEGMTFGPNLGDGSRTLYLLSDNNGRKSQRTVFLVLDLDHFGR